MYPRIGAGAPYGGKMSRKRHKNQRPPIFGKGSEYLTRLPGDDLAIEERELGTVGTTADGRPRELDYRAFDVVDWSAADEYEEWN